MVVGRAMWEFMIYDLQLAIGEEYGGLGAKEKYSKLPKSIRNNSKSLH